MNEKQQPDLSKWDDFSGEYLKTDLCKFPLTIVPVEVKGEYDKDDKPRMSISFLYNEKNWKLELNKTNQNFIRAMNMAPHDIVGKKLTFEKIMVRNPSTQKQVPSFLMNKIE